MYNRQISDQIRESLEKYRVITLVGPRQSGKTTLARMVSESAHYLNLEAPDTRERALRDPREFLKHTNEVIILDEIQRAPDLLSYLQTIVDDPNCKNRFILTGSHNLLLMSQISQSLAGRTKIFQILPLSIEELLLAKESKSSIDEQIFFGGYPRIYHEKLNPTEWYANYYHTYVERDLRLIQNITDLNSFDTFVRVCTSRVGQLINTSSIGNDCGITHPTIKAWLSLLETCYITFTLKPHFKNFNKRLVKTPKLYFYDTGLLCYLLQIRSPEHLKTHPLRGQIFENWVIVEILKHLKNRGKEASLYFWRDQKGHEVDVLIDRSEYLYPIEIKSSTTFNAEFIKNILYLNNLQNGNTDGLCIYSGDESFIFQSVHVSNLINALRYL